MWSWWIACVQAPPLPEGGVTVEIVTPDDDSAVLDPGGRALVGSTAHLAADPVPWPAVSESPPTFARWGDLHAHSGFSADGCEDPTAECVPDAPWPARDFFARAAENGLSFAAITDHAEMTRWTNVETGASLDIWEETLRRVADAEDGPVVPIAGYEWTAERHDEEDHDYGGHRTVVFGSPAPCVAYRVPGSVPRDIKLRWGHEAFTVTTREPVNRREAFHGAMTAAAMTAGCAPARWLSWLHHPALSPPISVDWDRADVADDNERLVEIYSEHGSSECADLDAPGCDFSVQADRYVGSGSVQAALQTGQRLGFVGGTDGHDGDPGSLENGSSSVGFFEDTDADGLQDAPLFQFGHGGLTGVLSDAPVLDRDAAFDALEARHTVTASWRFDGLSVRVIGADGSSWLPGDVVPPGASPLTVWVDLGPVADEVVEAVMVDAWGVTVPFRGSVPVGPGDARYVRIDVRVDDAIERVWLSPFFGAR